MASSNLTEALYLLNKFIESSGLSNIPNILECPNISYHLDSATMKAMIESNIALIKRLQTAPSGFTQSNRKFGGEIKHLCHQVFLERKVLERVLRSLKVIVNFKVYEI